MSDHLVCGCHQPCFFLDSSGNQVTEAVISVTDSSGNIVTGRTFQTFFIYSLLNTQRIFYKA